MKIPGKAIAASAAALSAAGVAATGAILKKKQFCPKCWMQKKLEHFKQKNWTPPERYDNGAALTPPMGWSSWNAFREKIDEQIIRETAAVMKEAGLVEAGYRYLNLDDCWQSSLRDQNDRLQGDLTNFPSGMAQLARDVNAQGMKLGLYSSNGTLTCEDLPASLGHEAVDAQTLAEWGVEFFKYDFCHNVPIPAKAPDIERIFIGRAGQPDTVVANAAQGECLGMARLMRNDRLPTGEYITGLSADGGSVTFRSVSVAEAGAYILTLGLYKNGQEDKYIEILVNETDTYSATLPGTKSPSPTGRHQIPIRLEAGENTIKLYNPISSGIRSAARQYAQMGRELKKAAKQQAERTGQPEKPIVFSICEWGFRKPWLWGRASGNLWRTTGDIFPKWTSILAIYERTIRLSDYAGVGGWNDPDMLEVGNGDLTMEENRTHFTLWCMMAAPLILGNDIRLFRGPDGKIDRDNKILQLLTNPGLIAVDQDARGIPGRRLRSSGFIDVILKPLSDQSVAVCLFNKTSDMKNTGVRLRQILDQADVDLPEEGPYQAVDLWEKTTRQVTDAITADVPGHGVKVFRISK